jgi:Helix-turn-helix domain
MCNVGSMPSLAAYPTIIQRDRKREGLRVCRAAWLVGVTVREYREMEAGDQVPSPDVSDRLCDLYGWPGCRPLERQGRW